MVNLNRLIFKCSCGEHNMISKESISWQTGTICNNLDCDKKLLYCTNANDGDDTYRFYTYTSSSDYCLIRIVGDLKW